MKTYQFQGDSDDTFAETSTLCDGDNRATGKPIQFELLMSDGSGIRVTGCYGTEAQGVSLGTSCWMIGVESLDEEKPLDWKITHQPSFGGYENRLTVEAPDEAVLTLLNERRRV